MTQASQPGTTEAALPLLRLSLFFSGFASLLYQVIWLRLCFQAFGVITPVISVVVSSFMAGLAIGATLGARLLKVPAFHTTRGKFFLYASLELIVALGALIVPAELRIGSVSLLSSGESNSAGYLARSAFAIILTLVPWCIAMGATLTVAVGAAREALPAPSRSRFQYLYTANLAGAAAGSITSGFVLIELFGFRSTILLGFIANCFAALLAILTSRRILQRLDAAGTSVPSQPVEKQRRELALIFVLGCASLGLEVVWTRAFTPIMLTSVYAFSALLTTYLLGNAVGSGMYSRARSKEPLRYFFLLGAASALVLITCDPRVKPHFISPLVSIFPAAVLFGYLSTLLIDRYANDLPSRLGTAYAANTVGCILGPLLAGYLLLPALGVKWCIVLFSLLLLTAGAAAYAQKIIAQRSILLSAGAVFLLSLFAITFEDPAIYEKNTHVLRDHVATVIATGEGMEKRLYVNGVGITHLTPITKMMAHLPLATLSHPPKRALIICFGMGTSFRSALSWGIEVKGVELVPSVAKAFPFFHADANEILSAGRGQIIVDDGRRYLSRTSDLFDVVVIDPPPPVEASQSGLLYSREFYRTLKKRLTPGGILQQWFPEGPGVTMTAVANAVRAEFRSVQIFHSMEGWGFHILASESELQLPNADALSARLPSAARADLEEWGGDSRAMFTAVLNKPALKAALGHGDSGTVILDDHPINEYFLLRGWLGDRRF